MSPLFLRLQRCCMCIFICAQLFQYQLVANAWTTCTTTSTSRTSRAASCLMNMASVSGIESTPNPSSFLVHLSEPLAAMAFMEGTLKGKTFTTASSTPTITAESDGSSTTSTEITDILGIDGVKSVYAMATPPALTINKAVTGKWEEILPLVITAIVGEDIVNTSTDDASSSILQDLLATVLDTTNKNSNQDTALSGQVRLRLQVSYRIPIQIECTGFLGTAKRAKASSKFSQSMQDLIEGADDNNNEGTGNTIDFFAGRKWLDQGVRYLDTDSDDDEGQASSSDRTEQDQEMFDIDTVLEEELKNLDAAYPTDRLDALVADARFGDSSEKRQQQQPISTASSSGGDIDIEDLDLQTVDHYCNLADQGDMRALLILAKFVSIHKGLMTARRSALAFLGGTGDIVLSAKRRRSEDKESEQEVDYAAIVLAAVVSALQHEKNPIMRRTAGDAVSDLGDDRAVPVAATVLAEDRSKLVQWRAARILGELGASIDVVGVLKQASFSDKYAFEVAFEIKDALRKVKGRIQQQNEDRANGDDSGGPNTGTGPVWKQIQQGMDSP